MAGILKLGKRGWFVAGTLFIVGILTLALWPVPSRFLWSYPSAYGSPLVAPDGTIYINNYDGELVALNPDGTVRWKSFVGRFGIIHMARGPDGAIYVSRSSAGANPGLTSISPNGATNWVFRDAGPVSGKPAFSADGAIYVGGHRSNFHALNPDGTERWRYPTGGRVPDSPVVAPDGTIAFVSDDSNCYALNPDGTLQWQTLLKNQRYRERAFSPALALNGSSILAVWSNVVALGAEGIIDWKADLFVRDATGKTIASAWGDAAPMVAATGDIFITSSSGDVHALAANGAFRWSYDRGAGPSSSWGPN